MPWYLLVIIILTSFVVWNFISFRCATSFLPYFHSLENSRHFYRREMVRSYFLWTFFLFPFSVVFIMFTRAVNTHVDKTDPILLKKRQRELEQDIWRKEQTLEELVRKDLEADIQQREKAIEKARQVPTKKRLKDYLR